MSNSSPLPYSYSPSKDQPPRSAFQWPAPLSPRFEQDDTLDAATNTDIPLKDILEKYKDDADMLQHILVAKAEEDKKQAARDILKTEQTRIHLKQLDLEYLREQNRLTRPYYHPYQPSTIMESSLPPPSGPPPLSSSATAGSPYAYDLAPVQQQVLARFNGSQPEVYPPSSPVAYPHSAHPLCPPTDPRTSTTRHYHHRLQPPSINTTSIQPISPAIGNEPISATPRYKRTRPQSKSADPSDDKLSHNKVMEALKAKIQRGNGSPVSATPPTSGFRPTSLADAVHMDKRQRQLPKPIMDNSLSSATSTTSSASSTSSMTVVTSTNGHPILASPSPRSAKPILPPIDTSVGQHHHRDASPDHLSPSDPLLPISAHHRSSSSRSTPPLYEQTSSRISMELN